MRPRASNSNYGEGTIGVGVGIGIDKTNGAERRPVPFGLS
jgi:hypothetical protein